VKTINRKEKVIKLINENPGKTGNELYKESIRMGFGIQKKEFYQTLRIIRKLSEPSLEKKEKSIPFKYKKPKLDFPRPRKFISRTVKLNQIRNVEKEGSYNVAELKLDDHVKYVKYTTRKQFLKEYDRLKEKYKPKTIRIRLIDIRIFTDYETKEDIEMWEMWESIGL